MKERPDDVEGWIMLARSYTVLGRFADAVPAYARAVELQPRNASLLADYADTVAATKRTADNPESVALIERALAIDPGHPKALALAGTVDYDRGDYSRAIDRWQLILERVSPESELGQQITGSIADARAGSAARRRRRRRVPPAPVQRGRRRPAPGRRRFHPRRPAGLGASPRSAAWSRRPRARRQSRARRHRVRVRPRRRRRQMPLAVQRAEVADLPLRFKLDDSMAMAPGMTVSSAKQVIVVARISKSGQATPSPGDLAGEAAPVAPGAANVAVRIDRGRGDALASPRCRRERAGPVRRLSPPARRRQIRLPRRPLKRPSPSISPARSASRAIGLNSSASTANTGAPP